MDIVTEKLIEAVQKHPYLYNIRHVDSRNHKRKAEAWKEISQEIGVLDEEFLKRRWRSLRDCYRRYKLANKSYDNWIWASRMCFLDPIVNITPTEIDSFNSSDTLAKTESYEEPPEIQTENEMASVEYCTDSIQDIHTGTDNGQSITEELHQIREHTKSIGSFRRRRRAKNLPSRKKKFSHGEKLDRIDQLFLSYADTFKTFTRRRKAIVKLQMAKIFTHAELQDIEETAESSPKNNTLPIETVLTPVFAAMSDDSCNSTGGSEKS
ncbi:Transcription factor Adf-1 [Eumeta japonica]|uniref:Transcription factor Adf-1 n=1 Tax=Eumeta variegata TaxID=151549 RepID=A0A4C1Z2W6_EUMVA|nr:Transcription factor Adf-1 [Eumeta japonica]